ncbi:hypothetical protein CSC70_10225 [Pseudoxanthomonas kalamensis DSM 18571]|uniref:DUF6164 family protein n=1 Tax=Pseudoxanthomonas kalamensis TaxID=289483 RepID=UPI0013913B15|nr:DUF6164 family protein [Pseudoxanthomonas kalamensis]KAF1710077.1 hypothetical protein CSC70_10225 [Pseudoxanthomonas kalamensis DSM 18571]
MSRLLLNLRNVPDDEADEVRAWLDEHGIAFYETRPGMWGITAGGIWISDEAKLPQARELMRDYQAARSRTAKAEREQALREGRAETFLGLLRARPGYVLGMLAAMLAILGLTLALPYLLLR